MSAPKGGKRPGAGRKPGSKNRRTVALAEALAEMATGQNGDLMPKDFFLSIMRDEGLPLKTRMDAGAHAAPYVHAKLSTVDVNAKVQSVTQEEALAMLDDPEAEDED